MIENCFALPIYNNKVSDNLIQHLCQLSDSALVQNRYFAPDGWNSHYILEFSKGDKSLDTDILNYFKQELKGHITLYLQSFNSNVGKTFSNDFQITNSWFSLFKQHHFAHIHMHSDADVSGVIYLQDSASQIYFLNPNKLAQHSRTFTNIDPQIFFNAQKSRILLFPGWLEHGVQPNLSVDNRVSFSFNIIFKR